MQLAQLSEIILKKIKSNTTISCSDWPDRISIPSKITKSIKNLSRYTDPKNSKKELPSGWEYEQSILFFDGELLLSEPTAGNYERVKPKHSFSASPQYVSNSKMFFDLKVDNRKYKSKEYMTDSLVGRDLTYGFIASFHTHPKRIIQTKSIYSFYSVADLTSLIYGNIPMIGLIWGNSYWLACKSSSSKIPPLDVLDLITKEEFQSGIPGVIDMVKQNLLMYDLVFYQASLGNILRRI
ncbi:hypothetical protein KC669_02945 [Candidatus Dojkabacteria bacterium]|uniref:Uncharacterized protein n=1 Tax=Candidatus Dojkabacteria bacterium TaxID=2099670 RepID=A0A955RM35_9BACT|nr:hypothetical protein [Candidatus Dojkabacteria bacterium]